MKIRMTAICGAALASIAIAVTSPTAMAAPAAPNGAELTGKLHRAINRAADRDARLAELADPSALAGADNIGALNDTFGWAFRWKVEEPNVSGDSLHAQMAVTLIDGSNRQGQVQRYPLTWSAVDGSWRLSKDSVCAMAHRFQTTC